MEMYPPIVPGVTEAAEGSDHMQLLASLALKRMRSPKKFNELFDSLQKLFTPKDPGPEPETNQAQPQQSGQALASVLGQPAAGPMGY